MRRWFIEHYDSTIACCIVGELVLIGLMWLLGGWQSALFLTALVLVYICTPPA